MTLAKKISIALFAALCSQTSLSHAAPVQLISNGSFETGDFTSWTVIGEQGRAQFAGFPIDQRQSVVSDQVANSPRNGFALPQPTDGDFQAVLELRSGSRSALVQTFTVPQVQSASDLLSLTLNFSLFTNGGGLGANGNSLFFGAPNRFAQVDILNAGALPFTENAADIVTTIAGPLLARNGDQPTLFTADLLGLLSAGETYQLRFVNVEGSNISLAGIDNVSIAAQVPEPASLLVLGFGAALVAAGRRRK